MGTLYAAASTLRVLDSVYHSALRFIIGNNYITHYCTVYDKSGWPYLFETLVTIYLQDHQWKLPSYISSLVFQHSGLYLTNSGEYLMLQEP